MKKILILLGLFFCIVVNSQQTIFEHQIIDSYNLSGGSTTYQWWIPAPVEFWNIYIEWDLDTISQNIKIKQTSKPNATSSDYSLYPNMDSLIIDEKTGHQEFQDLNGFGGRYIQIDIDTTITTTGPIDAWIRYGYFKY